MKRLMAKTADTASDRSPNKADVHALVLVVVIACLLLAIVLLRSPDAAMLAPEQISLIIGP